MAESNKNIWFLLGRLCYGVEQKTYDTKISWSYVRVENKQCTKFSTLLSWSLGSFSIIVTELNTRQLDRGYGETVLSFRNTLLETGVGSAHDKRSHEIRFFRQTRPTTVRTIYVRLLCTNIMYALLRFSDLKTAKTIACLLISLSPSHTLPALNLIVSKSRVFQGVHYRNNRK